MTVNSKSTNLMWTSQVKLSVLSFHIQASVFSSGSRDGSKLLETEARIKGPLPYDDPDLLRFVRQDHLYPPSNLPYNLVQDHAKVQMEAKKYSGFVGEFGFMFYAHVLRNIFKGTREGFFVEAGALDGEFLSNTLPLERDLGWTGLLVESNGDTFKELLMKRRKAWASHSCLAAHEYPHGDILVKFRRDHSAMDMYEDRSASAHSMMMSQDRGATMDNSVPGHREYEAIQCIPLATLLLAIDVTHVDLVSLDIEGGEMGVLRYFPWDRITVDVWLVEHATGKDKFKNKGENKYDSDFIKMFNDRGYELYSANDDATINYVFVLRSSKVYSRLKETK
ncbi:uncharacterized protein LOC125045933 [Penaeus chinensis]|uniref:uncharacterized protein LOC125045933 n=1 Tax=Penaeus chinensis TaxID=139456 RepID=UPI001FB5A5FD|nr:uncharacterized protein LOC125045933 [Penaeus chinensis]